MADVNTGDSETFAFHEQIKEFLSLIIHTDYNNKEIFLGSLISISNEALDKIRVESFTDESKLDAQPELYNRIVSDKTNNTLSIIDSGIGMTKADLVNNFATSSVRKFGVRFYMGLLVAEKVIATTRHNNDEQYVWESQAGDDSFTVTRDVNGEQLGRGNKIILFLKEDQLEYLEETRIKDLVTKHTKSVSYPIYLWSEIDKVKQEEGVLIGKESKEIKEVSGEWELINKKPIWLRKPEETTKDEYASFYKSLAYSWEDYLVVKHFSVEGQVQFNAILFVPNRPPLLLESKMKKTKKKSNIRLYVRRVFIIDNCEELIPEYLGFVKGVVDCDDLPLNISPDEMLQQNKNILQAIRESLVQKCFEMFYEIAERKQDYIQFYKAFSRKLELGIHEDNQHRAKLVDLLQYHSTKSDEELTSLKGYTTRVKGVQKAIAVRQRRTRLVIRKKGPQYQSMVEHAVDKHGWEKIVAATKGLKLDDKTEKEKRKKEARKKSFEVLCKMMKDILGHRVEKVLVSDGSLDSPCGLVTCGEEVKDHTGKKIMEINPDNYIIKELRELVEARNEESTKELVLLLFETALLTSGFSIDEPKQFASRIHGIFKLLMIAYKEAKNAPEYEDW